MSNHEPTLCSLRVLHFCRASASASNAFGGSQNGAAGDASDVDRQLVRANERARTSQTPDNSSERSRRICLANSAIYWVVVGLPVSANSLSRLSCSLSMLSTPGAILSNPPPL